MLFYLTVQGLFPTDNLGTINEEKLTDDVSQLSLNGPSVFAAGGRDRILAAFVDDGDDNDDETYISEASSVASTSLAGFNSIFPKEIYHMRGQMKHFKTPGRHHSSAVKNAPAFHHGSNRLYTRVSKTKKFKKFFKELRIECSVDTWTDKTPNQRVSFQGIVDSGKNQIDVRLSTNREEIVIEKSVSYYLKDPVEGIIRPLIEKAVREQKAWVKDPTQLAMFVEMIKSHPRATARRVTIVKNKQNEDPGNETPLQCRVHLPFRCRIANERDGCPFFYGSDFVTYPNGEIHLHLHLIRDTATGLEAIGCRGKSSTKSPPVVPLALPQDAIMNGPCTTLQSGIATRGQEENGNNNDSDCEWMEETVIDEEEEKEDENLGECGSSIAEVYNAFESPAAASVEESSYPGMATRSRSPIKKRKVVHQDDASKQKDGDDDDFHECAEEDNIKSGVKDNR